MYRKSINFTKSVQNKKYIVNVALIRFRSKDTLCFGNASFTRLQKTFQNPTSSFALKMV